MTPRRVQAAFAHVPGWSADELTAMEPLGGSNTNDSWLVERNGERYVLRLDTPRAARLGLDRERETLIRKRVAAAGLAPAIVHSDPARGILLSEYVGGRTWTNADLHDRANLDRLAKQLKTLHSLGSVGAPLDLAAAARRYATQIGSAAASEMATQVSDLLASIDEAPQALCHNDLVAGNMILGERLWLIDWEYAATGDPRFDLAVVIEHHDLPPALWRGFATSCLGALDRQTDEALARYRAVYRLLVSLWTDSP